MRKVFRFMGRTAVVGAAMLAVVAPASANNGNGNAGSSPRALPPEAAAAAANAPGIAFAGAVTHVTAAAALAAGSQPGADTEVAEGMTPAQAVGMSWTSGPRRPASARRAAAWVVCNSVLMGEIWGIWPYQNEVDDYTYWCGDGATITYRTTHVTLSSRGGLCTSHDAYGYKIAGGVGYYYEEEHVGGYFDCPTAAPWITWHENRSFNAVVTADGAGYIA